MVENKWINTFNVRYPIFQAPMAGGITTTELVCEAANHGCLGMIAAGYLTPEALAQQIDEVKKGTKHSFGVNLFVPSAFRTSQQEINLAKQYLEPFHQQLEVQKREVNLPDYHQMMGVYNEHIEIIIKKNVKICSFTFGLPTNEMVQRLKRENIILIATATTVKEAIAAEKAGMDAVVVQGSEAGGHRGHFMDGVEESSIGLMSLLPQVVDQVSIPVIAAGGIMDGRGLAAALCLGAEAVQMGTAFLTCAESGAPDTHKEAIMSAGEDEVILTKSFSGKWARGISNTFTQEMKKYQDNLPSFPVQNSLTQPMRKAASQMKNKEYMSLWSGQSPRLTKNTTVKTLIELTIQEAREVVSNIND
ncbi:nitronate monooxygenase [Alkalihalophilus marmarensis]|uniref:NAD(P)H-dependent flavin oxidoreductase n=1 Tax=Alkalihalophilus marmarensis TaxID=521377 RepID=UPI002E23CBAD|nr:nitronate monooxygenase [Alkalihalophilus marmarensis]